MRVSIVARPRRRRRRAFELLSALRRQPPQQARGRAVRGPDRAPARGPGRAGRADPAACRGAVREPCCHREPRR